MPGLAARRLHAHPRTEPCPHCADLEEQVAYLRSELGISRDSGRLSTLATALRLSPREAHVLLGLHQAHPRTISLYTMQEIANQGGSVNVENLVRQYITRLRKLLGQAAIETLPGHGYRLSSETHARIAALLEEQPA